MLSPEETRQAHRDARPYMGQYIDRKHYRRAMRVRAASQQCAEMVANLAAMYRARQFGPNMWLHILNLQSEVYTRRCYVVNGGTDEQMDKWQDELWDAYEAIEELLGDEQ